MGTVMGTGRSNQLIKQIGEYLVACEIARLGFLVATFSGGIPDFDLIVTDDKGHSCPIQVKTIKGGAWQFSIEKFVEVTFDGKKQIIGDKKPLPIPQLLCVFVLIGTKYGEDQFFVVQWSKVQDILIKNYTQWLEKHGGVRPRKYDSTHCVITRSDLLDHKDNWSIIDERFYS